MKGIDRSSRLERMLRLLLAAGLGAVGFLWSPEAADAQVNFFLYRTGNVLFLNQAIPQSPTSTHTTSPLATFGDANPWTDVGTWSAEFRPAPFVAVISASALHVWLGLDDGRETAFDLKAEVWVKGVGSDPVLVAQGLARCIADLAGDQSKPKEVAVPFTSTSADFQKGTERVSLKVFTRIGTTLADKRCAGPHAGHKSAVALRLYHGGMGQPSRFGLTIAIP